MRTALIALLIALSVAAEPSLAILGRTGLPIDDHLRARGWQTHGLGWGPEYKAEFLRRFQVIMIGTYPHIREGQARNDWHHVSPEYNARMHELLTDYVAGGGGLLIYASQHPTSDVESVNTLLAKWDAEFLHEQVIDPVHQWQQPAGMGWTWYHTQAVADHPVTTGVKTIFYPDRDIYVPANWALQTSDPWQVLVRGMDSAVSHPLNRQQERLYADPERIGSYAASPPLAAVRQAGEGRVAAIGWSPTHTFFNLDHFMVGNVYFSEGSGDLPADGMRFLEQLLTYLAAPAADAGYGGWRNEPNRPLFQIDEPVDWDEQEIGHYTGPWQKGLIGARTALTGGTGTVADYAAAARAAGLDFIAFLEDFTKLDEARWDAFRKECEAATTPELLVLPGLVTPRGPARTEYFVVSDFPWPPADMLNADGTAITNYLYAHFRMGLNTHGPFRIGAQKTPSWISRAYNSQAVVTTVDGDITLELGPYLYNVGIQDDPRPVAVDLITAPDQVAAAAGRFLNLRQAANQDELRRFLKNPDRSRAAQVSNGPVIRGFQGRNQHPLTGGRHVPGRNRWQVRIVAEADVPLRELIVYDGTRVFRRHALDEPRCDLLINGVHDRQYQLTAVVRDSRGRLAVRGPLVIIDQFNRRSMCSDRQNSLGSSRQPDADGYDVNIPANVLHPKFATHGHAPGIPAAANTVSWVPWYWDGTPGATWNGNLDNGMLGLDLPEPEHRWTHVHRMEFPMGSGDVIVQGITTEHLVDKPVHSRDFTPIRPLPNYRVRTRLIEWKKTPDAPAAMLIEGVYEMTADGQWPDDAWLYGKRISHPVYSFSARPDTTVTWSWIHPDAADIIEQTPPPKAQEVNGFRELHPEGCLAFNGPQGSLALIALGQPLGAWVWLHRERWLRGWLGPARAGESYRTGDRVPYRLLVVTGSVDAGGDMTQFNRFRRVFGLDGGEPAYTVTPRRGRVLDTRYVLELAAVDWGFSGTIGAAELPHRLPVRVHGVNPNWTAGLVDVDTGAWRPVGVLENMDLGEGLPVGTAAAYAAIELGRPRDLWIGNLVLADTPGLRLTLVPDGTGGFAIDAHNPGTEAVTATIGTAAGFTPAPGFTTRITVPPRSTRSVAVDTAQ